MDAKAHLTSLDNPRVVAAARLRVHRNRRKEGLFLAEGAREITRAAAAGIEVVSLFVCADLIDTTGLAAIEAAVDSRADWFTTSDTVLKKMAYRESPEGAVAVCRQRLADTQHALASTPDHPAFVMVAAGLNKPGNLGAIARTADAAGATGMVVADGVVDIYNPNAIRASTGAVFTLPIVALSSSEAIEACRATGLPIIATSPDAQADYTAVDMTGPVAVVIGTEESGLDERWLEAGTAVRIAMNGVSSDSLNASAAAAVLAFEVVRQRAVRN